MCNCITGYKVNKFHLIIIIANLSALEIPLRSPTQDRWVYSVCSPNGHSPIRALYGAQEFLYLPGLYKSWLFITTFVICWIYFISSNKLKGIDIKGHRWNLPVKLTCVHIDSYNQRKYCEFIKKMNVYFYKFIY